MRRNKTDLITPWFDVLMTHPNLPPKCLIAFQYKGYTIKGIAEAKAVHRCSNYVQILTSKPGNSFVPMLKACSLLFYLAATLLKFYILGGIVRIHTFGDLALN